MRKLYYLLAILFISTSSFAQSPELFNYQAVVRDASGNILGDSPVTLKLSILQGSANGNEVFTETHSLTTNGYGLITIPVGSINAGDFEGIEWSAGPFFLKMELDETGGDTFREMGTTQLLSVPYALYAKESGDAFSGNYEDLANTPATSHSDSSFTVKFTMADEDFIDFGTLQNFTNSSDWSIIERVKMPAGMGAQTGWHFFRGKAWVDLEGDIAIQLAPTQIHAWCRSGGWQSITYAGTFAEDTWYTICFQHDASENTIYLYVDGQPAGQKTEVPAMDDSGNTNSLFWGGQDVDPSKNQGDLYTECSIIIGAQDWYQRLLTEEEIQSYTGENKPEDGLFFSAIINHDYVSDNSGNGRDGTNGNSPEYIPHYIESGSEFNDDLFVKGNLTVTGNLKVGGNLTVDGEIKGNMTVDTIHFSQISGLLGQGYSAIFPQILDNTCELEIEGIGSMQVVMVGSIGTETERISTYLGENNGISQYKENAGLTMEFPLIFETLEEDDSDLIIPWFEEADPVRRSSAVIIKDVAATETGRWNLLNYLPGTYSEGADGRTRFTLVPSETPDNNNDCEYQACFGTEHSYNPETDKIVTIEGLELGGNGFGFTPGVEVDTENRTITLTMDYNEGSCSLYDWVTVIISGADPSTSRVLSIIESNDGTPATETGRYNYFNVIPIRYEHIYGFGLNTKLKAQLVLAYGWVEEG